MDSRIKYANSFFDDKSLEYVRSYGYLGVTFKGDYIEIWGRYYCLLREYFGHYTKAAPTTPSPPIEAIIVRHCRSLPWGVHSLGFKTTF